MSVIYIFCITERKPKNPLSPPPTIKSLSSQFDVVRHKLLGTRLEEAGDRPQEVPQSAGQINTSPGNDLDYGLLAFWKQKYC